jgi:hypothetical protein
VKKRRKKKPKKPARNLQNTAANPEIAPTIELPAQPTLPTPQKEPHPLGKRFQIGTIAALVTILLAGPPFFDEYNKTSPSAELNGNIDDEYHPFNVPLVIKDMSAIFNMYDVEISCNFSVVWNLPTGPISVHGTDGEIYKAKLISPAEPFFFISQPASTMNFYKAETGERPPIQDGLLEVTIKYRNILFGFWKIPRKAPATFTLLRTLKGLRWIEGQEVPNVHKSH